MKIEEAKALFFANYIGAEPVQQTNNSDGILSYATYSDCVKYGLEKRWLLLRSVQDLTDEECYQIDLLLNPKSQIETKSNKAIFDLHVKMVRDILTDGYWTFHRSIWDLQPILDYLRSISILIPFTYLSDDNKPITLSCEEIIDLGWAKTK